MRTCSLTMRTPSWAAQLQLSSCPSGLLPSDPIWCQEPSRGLSWQYVTKYWFIAGKASPGCETDVIVLHTSLLSSGDRYWVFKDNNVEEGYPRPISDFGLPPGGIDAAFSWAHNDKTYFFKDNLCWRYDDHERRMDAGYPSETIPWKGIPSPLDDAMRWSDGESVRWVQKVRKKAMLWDTVPCLRLAGTSSIQKLQKEMQALSRSSLCSLSNTIIAGREQKRLGAT